MTGGRTPRTKSATVERFQRRATRTAGRIASVAGRTSTAIPSARPAPNPQAGDPLLVARAAATDARHHSVATTPFSGWMAWTTNRGQAATTVVAVTAATRESFSSLAIT